MLDVPTQAQPYFLNNRSTPAPKDLKAAFTPPRGNSPPPFISMREGRQRGGGYKSGCRPGSGRRPRERAQILPHRSAFPVLILSAAAAAAFEDAWPFTPPRCPTGSDAVSLRLPRDAVQAALVCVHVSVCVRVHVSVCAHVSVCVHVSVRACGPHQRRLQHVDGPSLLGEVQLQPHHGGRDLSSGGGGVL